MKLLGGGGSLTATTLINLLDAVYTAGGAAYTTLSGWFATYAGDGGEQVEPATAAEIRARTDANIWMAPKFWSDAWASVNLAPSSNVITVDGANFLRARSTITANTTSAPTGLDGEKRYHRITASGANCLYTPTVDVKHGFSGGILIFDGASIVVSYYSDNGSTVCELESFTGDRNQEVTLTPSSNAITINAAEIPGAFKCSTGANLTINAGTLEGRTIKGRITATGGADRTCTLSGWDQTYGGATSTTFVVPSGKTVRVLVEQQGSDQIFTVGQTSN
ncbi:MAG: hypothetical protein KAX54_00235 [Thauera sp.]|nr:hypothetical protein [Thauera sp.]